MVEHMKKINPEAAAAGVGAGAGPEHLRQPAAATPIEVPDSLPVDHDSLPVDSVPVEEGAAPANRFQKSLTGPLAQGLRHTKGKGKFNLSPQGSPQQPLPSPSKASATGLFDDADGASSCADTQLGDEGPPNSRDKLAVLKAKLPLKLLMSGTKLGRQERNVRQYLANNSLEPQDAKLLRNYMKLAPSAQTLIWENALEKVLGNVWKSMRYEMCSHYILVKVLNSKLCRWRLPSRSRPTMSHRCRTTS
jgi:hypothetical protein